jgi:predicted AAA+ superfamily ATPase
MITRIYDKLISQHFKADRQMLFFVGPRQVGKSTCSLNAKALTEKFLCLNWDNTDTRRWQLLAHEQLFREDIRDLTNIRDMQQLVMLAELLKHQTGQLINYSNLSNKLQISTDTVRRWCATLTEFYYGYMLSPWTKNISRSLLKNPKFYLWDWSSLKDEGAKFENFIAGHLLKAVHLWTDRGLGDYGLYFLRDKDQAEVDFLVTKNAEPWFLVEAKLSSKKSLSPSLKKFQKKTQAKHAFQVVQDLDYLDIDCFTLETPTIVPAKSLLSQLV